MSEVCGVGPRRGIQLAANNWLMSNITSAEDGIEDSALSQGHRIETFCAARPGSDLDSDAVGRLSMAKVIVPTDGASKDQLTN